MSSASMNSIKHCDQDPVLCIREMLAWQSPTALRGLLILFQSHLFSSAFFQCWGWIQGSSTHQASELALPPTFIPPHSTPFVILVYFLFFKTTITSAPFAPGTRLCSLCPLPPVLVLHG